MKRLGKLITGRARLAAVVAAAVVVAGCRPAGDGRVVYPSPSTAPGRTAAAPIGGVAALARAEWTRASLISARLEPMGRITAVTVHHEGSAEGDDDTGLGDVAARLRRIRASHLDRLHAGDIGYHYVIDRAGRVWECRPIEYQGAHAGNGEANRGNIGICVLGNFERQELTEEQKTSLATLLVRLMREHGIGADRVYTHREIKKKFGLTPTLCPGRNLQLYMDQLRRGPLRVVR